MSGQGKGNSDLLMLSPSEMRTGSARREDPLNTGSLLLSFMTQASGNVKTALEKPANFKRNINHRRYLQKQLRNFSKRKGDIPQKKSSPAKFKSSQGNIGKQNYKSQNIAYMKSVRDGMTSHKSVSEKERNALKERNLPASFWQEPIIPTFSHELTSNGYQYQARPEDYSQNPSEMESYLNGWNSAVAYDSTREFSSTESPADSIPSITSEDGGLSEEFMTGEELTRTLDIKDLYVPEVYSADKLLNDVQETMYAGQISPSQYYLPSPSPYNTDQAYFNFSFEHDSQGLPPIAMAFFSQNPLAQC